MENEMQSCAQNEKNYQSSEREENSVKEELLKIEIEENRKQPQYLKIFDLVKDKINSFVDDKEETYFTYDNGVFTEVHSLRSHVFDKIIRRLYFKDTKHMASKDSVERLKDYYDAIADSSETEKHSVYIRTAYINGDIYYDLANNSGDVIHITKDGWKKIQHSPIYFKRTPSMLPSVDPSNYKADFNLLRKHLRIENDDDWYLIATFILGSLYMAPYAILIHTGEQGTGKSTKSKMIAAVIDPSSAPLIGKLNSERDLFISGSNGHLLSFDNLSGVKKWASDALCVISTGGSYRTRKLYENDSEATFTLAKPLQMNGIDDIATRGDLISRSIILNHKVINSKERLTESVIWKEFYQDLPKIMSGVFDALSSALRKLPNITLEELPRMADYAIFGCAASESLGITPERFMEAYNSNLKSSNQSTLELNPIANAVIELLENKSLCPNNIWEGTMSELREQLLLIIPEDLKNSKYIPKTHAALSNKLRRLAPMFKMQGIQITDKRTRSARIYEISRSTNHSQRDEGDDRDDSSLNRRGL